MHMYKDVTYMVLKRTRFIRSAGLSPGNPGWYRCGFLATSMLIACQMMTSPEKEWLSFD